MITKDLLKKILIEQRKKTDLTKDLVKREELENISKFVEIKQNIIISGIRRCGKSTLLIEIIKKFELECFFINFQDERLSQFELEDFDFLHEVLIELFGKNKIFFLDEIQNIQGWEKWVRRMYDDDFKFFITGSNARLLSKELATFLTGRHISITLYPFSFKEFLEFKKYKLEKEDEYLIEKRALIVKFFNEYLEKGGFPEYLKDNRIEILQECFNDIIYNDVGERYKIENTKELKELGRYLITNTGSLTTYNQLKNLTRIKSTTTIIKYFEGLENAYLILQVPFFSFSLKKQSVNPFKVYSIDTGLKNAISFKTTKDFGKDYETITAVNLKRRKEEIYYWKNEKQEEVDFVVKEGRKIKQLIQVCYDLSNSETEKREIKSLLKASKELKCNNLLILTEHIEKEDKNFNKTIKYLPLWRWLLT